MRVGVLTGGGDAPGLNGIIESLVRVLLQSGIEVIGIRDGFEGIYQDQNFVLTEPQVLGAHAQAGSLLGTSNRSRIAGREVEFLKHFRQLRLDGLVAIGGDGTFQALSNVAEQIPLVGVPKTIDNDLAGTDMTFGFDTTCEVVADAVQSLRATAETHRRILVVETMGRTAGWIALGGGLASYADAILIPERPFAREALRNFVQAKQRAGRRGLLLCVAEGAMAIGESPLVQFRVEEAVQADRLGGISFALSRWLESELSWESRHVILGHLQRSRHPSTTDRFLTLAMGVEAARLVCEGQWGTSVVYRNGRVTRAPLADLMQPARQVPVEHHWVHLAQSLGLFI